MINQAILKSFDNPKDWNAALDGELQGEAGYIRTNRDGSKSYDIVDNGMIDFYLRSLNQPSLRDRESSGPYAGSLSDETVGY